jgi:hypothetical protein
MAVKNTIVVAILLLTLSFSVAFISCASFTPGSVDFRPAISTPGATTKDSVYILVTVMSSRQSKVTFDCDFPAEGIQPLTISISNRNSSTIEFLPHTVPMYMTIADAHERTKFNPVGRLLLWSIPWFINIAAGYPIYYGILWPIIGVIDYGDASTANANREDFFNRVALKPIKLQQGQDIQGIVFVQKGGAQTLQLTVRKENGQSILFDIYPQ